jgi:hypothetical protein
MTTVQCVRCKFIKRNGQRCKRNPCVRKDYCWQHLRSTLGVDVRPSTLAGAGMGLFAYKPFPNRSKVASYSGVLVPSSEAKDSQYAVAWNLKKKDLIYVVMSSFISPCLSYRSPNSSSTRHLFHCLFIINIVVFYASLIRLLKTIQHCFVIVTH